MIDLDNTDRLVNTFHFIFPLNARPDNLLKASILSVLNYWRSEKWRSNRNNMQYVYYQV